MTYGLSAETAGVLRCCGLDPDEVQRLVRSAVDEDLRHGPDVTTLATMPPDASATAAVNARRAGVLAGVPAALAVLDVVLGSAYTVLDRADEGSELAAGQHAVVLRGPTGGLLTAERTVLNLLGHLSGVATATASWVARVAGTGCAVRDSRKTHPGMRALQKYAVRAGGGRNHRMGLGDAVLIKDNHVLAAGSITAALDAARAYAPELDCEVEVDDLGQLDQALAAGADEVLLDNFTVRDCAEAARRRDASAPGTLLEASGGLSLDVAREYAATGVNYLAVGALTHSSPALDIGLDLLAAP